MVLQMAMVCRQKLFQIPPNVSKILLKLLSSIRILLIINDNLFSASVRLKRHSWCLITTFEKTNLLTIGGIILDLGLDIFKIQNIVLCGHVNSDSIYQHILCSVLNWRTLHITYLSASKTIDQTMRISYCKRHAHLTRV